MLAERHRARLAMQEGEVGARTQTRRGHNVARRLFQDQDQEQDHDRNHDQNNDVGFVTVRRFTGVEDNLTNQLSEEVRKDLATAKTRWNFDFVNESPLPGRWDWVKVGSSGTENEREEIENLVDNEEKKTDQREKSETEANEKDNNMKKEN